MNLRKNLDTTFPKIKVAFFNSSPYFLSNANKHSYPNKTHTLPHIIRKYVRQFIFSLLQNKYRVKASLYCCQKTIRPSDSLQPDYFYDFVLNILFPTIRIRSAVPCLIKLISVVCR